LPLSLAVPNRDLFQPWAWHRRFQPLDGINRARKPVYDQSVAFRGSHNGSDRVDTEAAVRAAAANRRTTFWAPPIGAFVAVSRANHNDLISPTIC